MALELLFVFLMVRMLVTFVVFASPISSKARLVLFVVYVLSGDFIVPYKSFK